jgi:AmmeMemoRadiSam system protein B
MGFAGSWYPAREEACTQQIEAFGKTPAAPPISGAWLGVVPHAGWAFSGRLAAQVFRCLGNGDGDEVELVIVLGGHLSPKDPVVAMCEGEWETPLGAFPIHEGCAEMLKALPGLVLETESRNYPDNSTELQLPFARYHFPHAELLPLRVPPGAAAQKLGLLLAGYLEASGLRSAVVASTDLTHYGPNYGFEPKGSGPEALRWASEENDQDFIRAVEAGEGEAIISVAARQRNACSAGAVAAINELARARGQSFNVIGHSTSATAQLGDTRNFVGYLGGVYA